jgi:hypothetical protein
VVRMGEKINTIFWRGDLKIQDEGDDCSTQYRFINSWTKFADFHFRSQMMDHGEDRFFFTQ